MGIKLEIKKHITKPFILGLLVVIITLNFVQLKKYSTENTWFMDELTKEIYTENYRNIYGLPYDKAYQYLTDRTESLKKKLSLYDDYDNVYLVTEIAVIENMMCKDLQYVITYPQLIEKSIETAEENLYGKDISKYWSKYNKMFINRYEMRRPEFGLDTGIRVFLDFNFTYILILLSLMYISSNMMTLDTENDITDLIIGKVMKRRNVNIKISSLLLMTAILVIFFCVFNLAFLSHYIGFDKLDRGLFSLRSFRLTPFNGSIMWMIIIVVTSKILAIYILLLASFLVSLYFKNGIASLMVSGLLIAGLIIAHEFYRNPINPLALIDIQSMYRSFDVIKILDYPILSYQVAFFASGFWVTSLVALIYWRSK